MGANYREALRILSRKLGPSAASTLGHPTAKGDYREALLHDFLEARLGSSFSGTKGEVIDSVGKTTGEFDVIVYDRRVGSCVDEQDGRHLVRVESVAATIEVKSTLTNAHLQDLFAHCNKDLLQLNRYYHPTELLRLLLTFDEAKLEATHKKLASGVNAMSHYESIPSIPSFVFAFDGISKESAAHYLNNVCPSVICVLGKYTIAVENVGFPDNPAKLVLWAEGDDALGAFAFLLEEAMYGYLESMKYVSPNWRRYFLSPEALRSEGLPKP